MRQFLFGQCLLAPQNDRAVYINQCKLKVSSKTKLTEDRAYRTSFRDQSLQRGEATSRPNKTMASQFVILLSLALLAYSIASPVPEATETTTEVDEEVIPVYAVIELVPVVLVQETTTEVPTEAAPEEVHKVQKRSVRGDNTNNDLLAQYEGSLDDTGLSSLAGRRIKFLPTWAG